MLPPSSDLQRRQLEELERPDNVNPEQAMLTTLLDWRNGYADGPCMEYLGSVVGPFIEQFDDPAGRGRALVMLHSRVPRPCYHTVELTDAAGPEWICTRCGGVVVEKDKHPRQPVPGIFIPPEP